MQPPAAHEVDDDDHSPVIPTYVPQLPSSGSKEASLDQTAITINEHHINFVPLQSDSYSVGFLDRVNTYVNTTLATSTTYRLMFIQNVKIERLTEQRSALMAEASSSDQVHQLEHTPQLLSQPLPLEPSQPPQPVLSTAEREAKLAEVKTEINRAQRILDHIASLREQKGEGLIDVRYSFLFFFLFLLSFLFLFSFLILFALDG
jgi:hypothetical protein